ncbi:GNAT family N-acetyltransferase [Actinokineospora globicatena]|uniref:N-acetyltransferase n=1 Tax=Actinokineospora globicatena TaxID=103729 RepID=A0A9W6QJX2_9PSEU|nr:GNAT family N-acetyltransferase [Actinokineospora globicatena]GLW89947.1 N-acetyltransferase [Actinokineospora globicatena]
MSSHQHDLILRPITGLDELDLFTSVPYGLNAEIPRDFTEGRRKPEWLWVALRGDQLVARAGWWSRPGDEHPLLMDVFDILGDTDDAIRLVETALAQVVPADATPPEYGRFLPPDWREQDDVRVSVERRVRALESLGAHLLVERLRLEWRPGTPIPELSGRLTFRTVADPEELIDLMTLVLDGTLDAHSRQDLAVKSAREIARDEYSGEFERYNSPREWWKIATLPDGDPVGFVLPAHNGYNPVISYIGVVPAHRGHGYIHDLLAMGTSVLAAEDVPRIRASTDVDNTPMAAAFAKAGYVTFQRQIDMTWH